MNWTTRMAKRAKRKEARKPTLVSRYMMVMISEVRETSPSEMTVTKRKIKRRRNPRKTVMTKVIPKRREERAEKRKSLRKMSMTKHSKTVMMVKERDGRSITCLTRVPRKRRLKKPNTTFMESKLMR